MDERTETICTFDHFQSDERGSSLIDIVKEEEDEQLQQPNHD